MWQAYDADSSPYSVPMQRDNLAGLPPAYIETAEIDPLHGEGVALAEKLNQAGVETILHETKGTVHGFDSTLGSSITIDSIKRRCEFLDAKLQ
jgi:acetyl esterase